MAIRYQISEAFHSQYGKYILNGRLGTNHFKYDEMRKTVWIHHKEK